MDTNRLSVIHLTPHFYWHHLETGGWPVKFDTMGGMQNQIFRQVHFLDKLKVQQLVITLIPGTPKVYNISCNTKVIGKRISILPIKSRIRGMVDLNISWLLGTLAFVIRNKATLKKKYKIIHCHCSGVGIPLIVGYLVARLLKLPLLTSIHCSAISTYKPMSYLDKYLHKLNILIEKSVLRKTNHIIFLTKSSMEKCAKYIPELKNKSSIVSDSIDSQYFTKLKVQYSKKDFIKQYNIPTNKPICIYVGRIAREKGWRDIVILAKQLKEKFHFLMVGDGNEFDLMKEAVSENNLHSFFTFVGYIPQEKVPVAMSLAMVLILPSRHEEFGSVLLESMTMSLVSIAYNVGGVHNVITHKKDGLLASNLTEMKKFMEEILDNKLLRENISKNAKKAVHQKFQLSLRGNEIYNIYKKISLKEVQND